MERFEIRIVGVGGQGIRIAGIVLATAAVINGLFATHWPSYGVEARGGPSISDIVISREEIDYPRVLAADVLAALNQEMLSKYLDSLKPNGILILDSSLIIENSKRRNITIKKASLIEGPTFIHIFSPCPTGWGCKSEDSILVAKLAVETRIFPLYEVIDGKYIINKLIGHIPAEKGMLGKYGKYVVEKKITPQKPVEEYLKLQRRFRHLTSEQIEFIQKRVDEEYEKLVKLSEYFGVEEE